MAASHDNDWMNNQTRMYYALDTTMLLAHRADDDEKAISIARTLVADSDVPLYIRCRACMVLGCSEEEDFLTWAEEGVRVGELILEVCGEGVTEVERTLARNAGEVLEGARGVVGEGGEKGDKEGNDRGERDSKGASGEERGETGECSKGEDGKGSEEIGESGKEVVESAKN